MFFILSGFTMLAMIPVFLAILPAIVLMVYVYRQDKIEPEPSALLIKLVGAGVLAGLLSMILEQIGTVFLNLGIPERSGSLYTILMAYLVVGVVEEGTKYGLMASITWKNPAFNFRFDGIVYAVFASLGFAAFENILYGFRYGVGTLATRAFLSIPGHMAFAVIFGIFYGHAKKNADLSYYRPSKRILARVQNIIGYALAVLFHGTYDACLMTGTGISTLIFVLSVVLIYVVIFFVIRRESRFDQPV